MNHRSGTSAALAAIALAVAGCSGSSSSSVGSNNAAAGSGTGTLGLYLTDAPRTDVAEIWVEIDAINVKPAGSGPALEFDLDPDLSVELLGLTPDSAATLLDDVDVPAGQYDWIELVVNAEFDNIPDSYVIEDVGGGQVELRVPSGSVRLVSGFTITADRATRFMIDWNARKGLVHPPGQPGYMLKPAFRIIDMTEYGRLSGTVAMDLITPETADNQCNADSPAADPDVGNVVYIYLDNGAVPDDIDGIDSMTDPNLDPVATADVSQDSSGNYTYSTILTPGLYTVAFTCQGGLDDPAADDAILFTPGADIEIVTDEETVVDFTSS